MATIRLFCKHIDIASIVFLQFHIHSVNINDTAILLYRRVNEAYLFTFERCTPVHSMADMTEAQIAETQKILSEKQSLSNNGFVSAGQTPSLRISARIVDFLAMIVRSFLFSYPL